MQKNNMLKERIEHDIFISHGISTAWVMYNFHFHDAFEIYLAMTDNIKYFVGDRIYSVNKGDLFIFNNMDLHKTLAPSDMPYERYVLTFKSEYIMDLNTGKTDLLECFLNRNPGFSHMIHLSEKQYEIILALY